MEHYRIWIWHCKEVCHWNWTGDELKFDCKICSFVPCSPQVIDDLRKELHVLKKAKRDKRHFWGEKIKNSWIIMDLSIPAEIDDSMAMPRRHQTTRLRTYLLYRIKSFTYFSRGQGPYKSRQILTRYLEVEGKGYVRKLAHLKFQNSYLVPKKTETSFSI